MKEKDFWIFLKKCWGEDGRVEQLSGSIDTQDPNTQKASEYIGGHSFLPNNYDKIPDNTIIAMGKLLLQKKAKSITKQAILIILAHHGSEAALNALKIYNENPDRRLKYFAEFALDESQMWHEG